MTSSRVADPRPQILVALFTGGIEIGAQEDALTRLLWPVEVSAPSSPAAVSRIADAGDRRPGLSHRSSPVNCLSPLRAEGRWRPMSPGSESSPG